MTPWLNGPFKGTDIVYRLARVLVGANREVMEFLGGSVVVIQIVGERRVESFARRIACLAGRGDAESGLVRMVSQKLNSAFRRSSIPSLLDHPQDQRACSAFSAMALRASYVLAAVGSVSSFFLQFEWSLLRVLVDICFSPWSSAALFSARSGCSFSEPLLLLESCHGISAGSLCLTRYFRCSASAISIGFLCLAVVQFSHGSLIDVRGSTVKKFVTAPLVILVVFYVLFCCYAMGVLFSLLILYGLALATVFVFYRASRSQIRQQLRLPRSCAIRAPCASS